MNWMHDERERAKARNAAVPPHAQMVITDPALSAHVRAASECSPECAPHLHQHCSPRCETACEPCATRTTGGDVLADHPHEDPGDGREQCETCGKWVWLVTHSCKGIRAARQEQGR